MSVLTVENLSCGYGKAEVLKGCSFRLEGSGLFGLLGANGSGKSTLLKALCGILPSRGERTLDGLSLKGLPARRLASLCGYIPQRSGIAIDIPVLDVVLMGFSARLGLLEQPNAAMRARAEELLVQVGLCRSLGREDPAEVGRLNYQKLSEGQKQLCILARALADDRALLLLDEPESALDFRYRHRLPAILRQWAETGGGMALCALHDPMLALNGCDRLLVLGEGRVLGSISPRTDPMDRMEALLGEVYGPLQLVRCADRSGGEQLVMLFDRGKE